MEVFEAEWKQLVKEKEKKKVEEKEKIKVQ
jgi:hypothetical protein